MSTFKVEVVKIDDVKKHPNADRLDLLKIRDWQCVCTSGKFKPGDLAVYFPIDSLLPGPLEARIFGEDSKVKLTKSRVKTIKLRGAISQGLAVAPEELPLQHLSWDDPPLLEGQDLTKILGVTKFEAPEPGVPQVPGVKKERQRAHPLFHEYTKIENAKNHPGMFEEGELVVITEKIHGTNFRCGWVPFNANTWWKKLKKFFKLTPRYEWVYGSHHVQLQNKQFGGFYSHDIYKEAIENYNLQRKLLPGEVLYGEIYGDGIQKGYTYGCATGERKLVAFDVKLISDASTYRFLDCDEVRLVCNRIDLPFVPILYVGPFNKEQAYKLRDGNSAMVPAQKVREGVVVKPIVEQDSYNGRKILKYISDEYLLRNQDNETIAH